jgi:hypothetical protein
MKKLLVICMSAIILFADASQFTLKIPIDVEPIKAGLKGIEPLSGQEIETNGKLYLTCVISGTDGGNMNKTSEIVAGNYTYDMNISLSDNYDPNKVNHYSCTIGCGVNDGSPQSVNSFFKISDFSKRIYRVSGDIN